MNKIFILLTTSLTSLLVISNTNSTTTNEVEINNKEQIVQREPVYYAWIAWWDEERALTSLQGLAPEQLQQINPVWYRLNENSEIEVIEVQMKQEIIAAAKDKKIQIVPVVANSTIDGFSPERVSDLIYDEEKIDIFIDSLIETAIEHDYQGWELDFEEIKKEDKQRFSNFVREVYYNLKVKDLTLSIAVHPQTGSATDWVGSQGQDWRQLSRSSDHLKIMVYDYHGPSTQPGSLTPIEKLIQVIDHAKETIPLDKIVIGLPTYGYEWSEEGVRSLQYQDILDIGHDSEFVFDEESGSYNFKYDSGVGENEVWFETTESLSIKMKAARELGIYQFTFWRLGGEDPNLWQ